MIRINFAGASLVDPGSYTDVQVAQSSLASPALGVVALIGEADEGPAFAQESGLSAVTFGPDEFSAIVDKFGSGELVDASKLAISPSNDPQIRGGAQELILIKTNASTQASLNIPAGAGTYGAVKALRAGAPGNNISYSCSIVSGQAIITLSRLDSGVTEISTPLGLHAVMTIQCTDPAVTAASLTITAQSFVTAITGGATSALNINLAQYSSVKKLVDYINSIPGYSASAASAAMGAKPVSVLDQVAGQDIKTAAFSINQDAFEVRDFFSRSSIAQFVPAKFAGLPAVMTKSFLMGGARGPTLAANVQTSIDALLKRRVNFVVPLFSRSASEDIVDGITDSGSTYVIEAIHAAVSAHCAQASTVKGRKERQGFVGFKEETFTAVAEQAAAVGSARVQMTFQDVDVLSASSGNIELRQPHMLAVLSAGMKAAAAVGLPNTFKQPQVSGFSHPDFDPEIDSEKAIGANLCFVEKAPNGSFRFKLDNSTYSQDLNAWVYNRPSVLYAADTAAYAIRINTEQFVGLRNSDISEETIKNLLVGVMDQLRSAGIIVADTNTGGRGYKDLLVKITGSIVEISVTLALVEGLEFILSSIKVQRAG